tara:strand:+ start:313 stop:864 length:552 start_codon:yes stop_codon:yes gene_type:complete
MEFRETIYILLPLIALIGTGAVCLSSRLKHWRDTYSDFWSLSVGAVATFSGVFIALALSNLETRRSEQQVYENIFRNICNIVASDVGKLDTAIRTGTLPNYNLPSAEASLTLIQTTPTLIRMMPPIAFKGLHNSLQTASENAGLYASQPSETARLQILKEQKELLERVMKLYTLETKHAYPCG